MAAGSRVERDFKGHLCVADDCRWFRTTDVGDYRISSIGDYWYPEETRLALGEPAFPVEIGWGRFYETMVFRLGQEVCGCGCGARTVSGWGELECQGYQTEAEAEAGHEGVVARYLLADSESLPTQERIDE